MADVMEIEILEDGTISVKTDAVSGKNHHSADEFLDMIEELTGGKRTRTPRKDKKIKHHKHAHHGH
jgi:hypothetical protein